MVSRYRKWRSWAAFLLCAMIVLGPSFAEARAGGSYRSGGGSSFTSQGSRGSNTYQNNGAAPMQRSVTPQTTPNPSSGYQPGYGYGNSHPFLTGLFGGLVGSWIGGMLFPHWGMGVGFGGMVGSVFIWLILLGAIWFAVRLFMNRSTRMSYASTPYSSGSYGGSGLGGPMSFGRAQGLFPASGAQRFATIGVTSADYDAFESILKNVQTAWSRGDLATLRRSVTPEMLSYFSEQLAENQSQGVINHVDDVELIKGEVREAWDEGRLHYATALMHWRARDYTMRSGGNPREGEIIVGGDPQNPTEASEMWTFARSPGGRWLLSAVQQT
jgi:predicted lipid-binding transport protein (Tim44 family)